MTLAAPSLRHSEAVMGTIVNIEVRRGPASGDFPDGREPAEAAIAEALRWLHWVDETFSTYEPVSQISRLARGELTPEGCHGHVRYILALCDGLGVATHGYFDARAGGRLDPSGVVKGWAIETASAILADRGWDDHLVECGGDIRARTPDGGLGWHVGIAHPFRRDALCAVVSLEGGAVATSGVYERGLHVVDPHRRQPATDLVSVTVVGQDLVETDAYATAALAMGAEGAGWLAGLHGFESLVVDRLGRATETPGFARLRIDAPTPQPA